MPRRPPSSGPQRLIRGPPEASPRRRLQRRCLCSDSVNAWHVLLEAAVYSLGGGLQWTAPGDEAIPTCPRLTTRLMAPQATERGCGSRAGCGAPRVQAAEALETWRSAESACVGSGGAAGATGAGAWPPLHPAVLGQ